MARTKRQKQPTFDYPQYSASRGGCKVGWLYYVSEEAANRAAEVAKAEARYKEGLGYDFGYCCPGSIRKLEQYQDLGPCFEVCIP